MWSFKKKKQKPSWIDEGIKKIKDFRDVGEKFNYLGIEMIVTGHTKTTEMILFGYIPLPKLCAEYVDKNLIIRKVFFNVEDLPLLIKEN